jgi:hypothetical protein
MELELVEVFETMEEALQGVSRTWEYGGEVFTLVDEGHPFFCSVWVIRPHSDTKYPKDKWAAYEVPFKEAK